MAEHAALIALHGHHPPGPSTQLLRTPQSSYWAPFQDLLETKDVGRAGDPTQACRVIAELGLTRVGSESGHTG
jgi:hypothetical protein